MLVTMKETVNSWTSSPQCVAGGGVASIVYCLQVVLSCWSVALMETFERKILNQLERLKALDGLGLC